MLAEIITIGDEILIGQIVDTNSAYISKELNKIGVQVFQITSIQDDRDHILQTLKEAQQRADIIIITGGLGPTKDDITKQTFCDFFEDTLVENPEVLARIKRIFKKSGSKHLFPANVMQAMMPSKATALQNLHGTAPGMWMEKDNTVFVSLPGVPYEMKFLLQGDVLPRIMQRFERPFIYHKTLLTYGLGESTIADRISVWEDALPKEIKLAYLPSLGKVRLRLSSKGTDEKILKKAVDSQMNALYAMLEDVAIGYEDETSILARIAAVLIQKKQTMGLAESCTGGYIAAQITSLAGAGTYFKGAIVPYETPLKSEFLGVPKKIIEENTVVSIPVAESMAINACRLFKTDYAISTTGIAGPTKGDGKDKIGTVCIAIASPNGIFSEKFSFGNVRERIIEKASNKALEMLLKEILKN